MVEKSTDSNLQQDASGSSNTFDVSPAIDHPPSPGEGGSEMDITEIKDVAAAASPVFDAGASQQPDVIEVISDTEVPEVDSTLLEEQEEDDELEDEAIASSDGEPPHATRRMPFQFFFLFIRRD